MNLAKALYAPTIIRTQNQLLGSLPKHVIALPHIVNGLASSLHSLIFPS